MTAETLALGDIDDDVDDIAKLLVFQLFEDLLMMVIARGTKVCSVL